MSERINVDHAFDPEARQAQADLDAYMDSRPYEDDKGNAHDAETGSFIKKDDFRYGENDKHYETTLEEGDYSSESLDQLAQRVAEARARGDKTGVNDAEELFFDKFNAYAEKYGWENEVVDESATGKVAVDNDAKIGRDTIDARLERYGKIMYGETETSEESETVEQPQPETTESDEPVTEEPEIRIEPWVPPMGAEEAEQKLESVQRVKAQMEAEQAEPEYDSEAQAERMDERLGDDIPGEGLEPLTLDNGEEIAAEEGESLEEYEARHGVDGAHEPIPGDGIEPLDMDSTEEEARASGFRRLIGRMSPTALAARASAWNYQRGERNRGRERSGNKKAIIGLGALAVATGVGIYLANRYGVDIIPGNNGGSGGGREAATGATGNGGGNGGGNRLNWNDFDPSARRVTDGEGWNQTFKEMGIPKKDWADVLNTAGPKLGKLGEAYYDNGAGEWRISRPGQLSSDALRVIASSSRKNGVEL